MHTAKAASAAGMCSRLQWTHRQTRLTPAEIEPGHTNASKYLQATEQHMQQLGIPTGPVLQPDSGANVKALHRSALGASGGTTRPLQQQFAGGQGCHHTRTHMVLMLLAAVYVG